MLQATHVGAGGLVAEDESIGLGAVDQAQRHAGEGRVKERALPLDDVPVTGLVVRAQPLDRTGDEVCHHGIDGDARTRDHHAGLAGAAEGGVDAARQHLLLDGECRVLLAARAVGADGQQSLAGALDARAGAEALGRVAGIEERDTMALGGLPNGRNVPQALVKARRDTHACLDRLDDGRNPVVGKKAARVRDADDERPTAGRLRLRHGNVLQAEIGLAAGQAKLAIAKLGPPILDAVGRLRGELIGDVAEKEQIGRFHEFLRVVAGDAGDPRRADSASAMPVALTARSARQ